MGVFSIFIPNFAVYVLLSKPLDKCEMVEHSKELPETNGVTNHFESTRFILTSHATSVKCGGLYILQ